MGNNRLKHIAAGLLLVCCFTSANAQMLSLDSCRAMALQHNKGSVISQESLLAAQEMRKAAFTQFLPSFNAAGAYMYNSKNISVLSEDALLPVGSISSDGKFAYTVDDIVTVPYGDTRVPVNSQGQPTTNPSEFVPKHVAYLPKESLTFDMEHVFAAGVGFTQPIFMGGKILSLYRMAQSAENIARIAKDNNDINIMIQVDEAYWRVVSLQKKVELAKEYNSLLQTTYNNVKIMYDEGVATKSDLLNVQVKLNESEMSLTKAENGLSLSKMYLNQICGMDFEQDYVLDGEIQTDNQNIDLDPDFKRDVALRPEAQMLDWNVKIAQSQVDIARSRFMPNVIASGNYVVSNPNLFNGFDKSFSGMLTFSVGVSVPVFHFGDRLHTLRAAKHNLRIAELTKEESLEKMQLQANMKRNSLTEAVKQNTMAANNLLHAEENMRQAQSGFEEGVISTSDLMAAQTSWVSAKSDVIDAKINMMLNELYLNQSLGKIQVKSSDNGQSK